VNAKKKAPHRRHKTFGPPPKRREESARGRRQKPAQGQRRSFSQANLEDHSEGPLGARLLLALRVPEEPGYQLTHAFHPYPGRFHPALPRLLLSEGMRAGQTVLDPFMGGGTTLVEAMLLGIHGIGNDLNPIAGIVARERTRPRTPIQAAKTVSEAKRIAGLVEALRKEKHPPRYESPNFPLVLPHYAPHLLAELAQWMRLIDKLPAEPEPAAAVRETLRAVFSAAVVKYSNQKSDSQPDGDPVAPTVPKGAVSRFLIAKCEELTRAQVSLGIRLPKLAGQPGPRVRLLQEDARLLPSLGWGEVDCIVTSPPYPGTYDYHHQHALRLAWLGIDAQPLEAGELASRRELAPPRPADAPAPRPMGKGAQGRGAMGKGIQGKGAQGKGAQGKGAQGKRPAKPEPPAAPRESWSSGLRDTMVTLARVMKPSGSLYMVLGDWMDDGHPVDGAAMLRRTAEDKGWKLASFASIRREAFSHRERRAFTKRGKWEHLLQFTR
jgi:DNA modification methylase